MLPFCVCCNRWTRAWPLQLDTPYRWPLPWAGGRSRSRAVGSCTIPARPWCQRRTWAEVAAAANCSGARWGRRQSCWLVCCWRPLCSSHYQVRELFSYSGLLLWSEKVDARFTAAAHQRLMANKSNLRSGFSTLCHFFAAIYEVECLRGITQKERFQEYVTTFRI